MANTLDQQKKKIQELVDFIKPIDDKAKSKSNDLSDIDQEWLNTHITGERSVVMLSVSYTSATMNLSLLLISSLTVVRPKWG